jgi:hypothetical protein
MKNIYNTLFVWSMLFIFIFYCDVCFAQTTDKTKQENKVKQVNKTEPKNKVEAQDNDNTASERFTREVKSLLRKQKIEWNEDQIQCAALYWQIAEKTAKTKLDNDFILIFMTAVNKFDKPKTAKELADEVVIRCVAKLQEVENVFSVLQSKYESQKTVSQIKSRSYSTSPVGDYNRIQNAAADPKRYEKVQVIRQLQEATIQQKRYTVYMNFSKKVQDTFKLSK